MRGHTGKKDLSAFSSEMRTSQRRGRLKCRGSEACEYKWVARDVLNWPKNVFGQFRKF
jgi:hypothetical protein